MKNNDLEYTVSREYTALPDEYPQSAGTPDPKNNKNKKSSLKRMFLMITSFSLLLYATIDSRSFGLSISPEAETSSQLPETPGSPVQKPGKPTKQPEKPTEQPENTKQPSLPVYPIEDGTSFLTVYNDTCDPENNWENKILAKELIFESTVAQGTEYAMPEYEPQEGFLFLGFVVYYDKAAKPHPRLGMLGDALTASNLCYIKPDENGSRNIEIHAAWRYDGISDWPLLLTLNANGGSIENESSMTYDAVGPMWSGATVYLCAYPVPAREGYTFTGWYDTPACNGTPNVLLSALSFCEQADDGTIDWSAKKPITLYAGWEKN